MLDCRIRIYFKTISWISPWSMLGLLGNLKGQMKYLRQLHELPHGSKNMKLAPVSVAKCTPSTQRKQTQQQVRGYTALDAPEIQLHQVKKYKKSSVSLRNLNASYRYTSIRHNGRRAVIFTPTPLLYRKLL
jgi:hypothetical protein